MDVPGHPVYYSLQTYNIILNKQNYLLIVESQSEQIFSNIIFKSL